jgi:hypothetical protein
MNHLELKNLPVTMTPDEQAAVTNAARKELGAVSALSMGRQDSRNGTDGAESLLSAVGGTYTDEDRSKWRGESDQKLRDLATELGMPTTTLIADANRWLARGPSIAKIIKEGALGDHPRIVEIAARNGYRLRVRGY